MAVEHGTLTANHRIENWAVDSLAQLDALSPVEGDVGKLAFVGEELAYFRLMSVAGGVSWLNVRTGTIYPEIMEG